MESRAPVSREVVHRAGAPPCAVDDGNAVQLAAICMIDHVGRMRKVSLTGFAIPHIAN
jgi:hypothetical protein